MSIPKKEMNVHNVWMTYLFAPLALIATTILFYCPSLYYDFQFDDIANIKKFFALRSQTFWGWAFKGSRWISYWLNSVNYKLGKFDPFYYRAFNITFHITTGILIFFVTRKLLTQTNKEKFFFKNAFNISCITSLLFLLHPVQTQTVSYVIQGQLEGLASLFMMAIALSFLNMTTSKNRFISYALGALICVLGFISCGTKEIAIMSPFMLLLIDWFFIAKGDLKKILNRAPFYLLLTTILVGQYLRVLKPQFFKNCFINSMELNNNVGNVITYVAGQKITRWNYFISQFKVIVHYLWIFICPTKLAVDYDWKMVPDFFSTECILPLLFLLSIAALIFGILRKNKTSVIAFGALWFFIGLSPRSTFIPSTELVADYKTYFSSFGIFLLMASGLVYLYQWAVKNYGQKKNALLHNHHSASAIICFSTALLGFSAYERNKVWRSQEEFWLNIVQNSPLKARGYNNYAVSIAEKGRFHEAIPYLRKAIKLDAYYPDPWSNIAVCYNSIHQVDMAIGQLEKAIKINPHYPEFYNNLASFYLTKKDYPRVEMLAQHAIKLRKHYGKAYFNWGQALYEQGKLPEAHEKLKIACMQADFDTKEGFTVYAQLSLELQKFDEAVIGYQRICAMEPNNPDHHFNLANGYYCVGDFEKARDIYKYLIAQNSQEYRSWFNLAETYLSLGDQKNAVECFKMAQPLGQQMPQFGQRIAQFVPTHKATARNATIS